MMRAAAAVLAALALAAPSAAAAGKTSGPLVAVDTETLATRTTTPPADPNALVRPTNLDATPLGHRLTPRRALAIAGRVPKIADMLGRHPGYTQEAYQKGTARWQVSYFDPVTKDKPRKEIGQVQIDDATGAVVEAWTGFQVAWTMARGYPGAFGRIVTSLWIWIPLSVLFLIPFVNPRRWRSWLHLDLLVFTAFSISLAFFDHANIGMSVPLVYPLLIYLLIRGLTIALRRGPVQPARLLVPVTWLAVATIFLLGFRIGLNATNSNVIDVGYAGVIGADRLSHGETLYGNFPHDNEHGDTYGPVVYETYLPFEQAAPWKGVWDDLPAAHGAAIVFDLLCVLLLFLLGRRARGPDLGIALAYAWAAYPFTIYASNSNTNDSLVAALVLLAILVAGRPLLRGGATALAGLTKFAPLALAPVLATHRLEPGRRTRGLALFGVGLVVAAALVMIPVFLHESLSEMYDRTVGFQASRGSPFSVWGLYGWSVGQDVVQALAVLLAVVLAFLPRRQDAAGLAAACAVVLIALQLGVTHWFYLYVPWFFGLLMFAALGRAPLKAWREA
jgi:hypothetical protein